MLLVGYCFGFRSERRLCEEVHLNLAYRWFCRLSLDGDVPDHSTFSKNRPAVFATPMCCVNCSRRCCGDASVRPSWRRGFRGRCQPDQGRRQPPALRARPRRPAAGGCQPRHRRVSGRAGRRRLRRRDPRDAQVYLTGRSDLALDRCQQGAGLLRLCNQLSDRSGTRDHCRCRAVYGGAPSRGDGRPHHDPPCA